ncbi:hypothetical protein DES53_10554 [Roseimicrobium gellanilyticum]|uniref:Glutathionylspermidine synthase n=2 Tax=Roseimicrobium gellanilyticum TaxID=748857 RepID=A0A366HMI7_9BACT|nr:hypothetical protein DES53_10554 [Roseimicrobium gellanilyticum]
MYAFRVVSEPGFSTMPASMPSTSAMTLERVRHVRDSMPEGGMFEGKEWRISPEAFPLEEAQVRIIEALGTAALAFQRACNRLYFESAEGGSHAWVARLLDQGKPERMVALGRKSWREEVPRVIRPDLILTETGLSITELDNLPGGIGLTGWLGETYATLGENIVGGASGMVEGFANAFPGYDILVSRESQGYQPEMEWLNARMRAKGLPTGRVFNPWTVHASQLAGLDIYRFFELWDLDNVEHSAEILAMAERGEIRISPPLKPFLEEKLWLGLFWSPALQEWWEKNLSPEHLTLLKQCIPYGWVLDPVKLPLHAEWPRLGIHSWEEMKKFGNKERELVIKISGWSEKSWGSRGVNIGHDLSTEGWAAAIDEALAAFPTNPHLMQRFHRGRVIAHPVWDEAKQEAVMMQGRVRLCPYYFVQGDEAKLSGVLATIVPADKKILHGMSDAMLVPCGVS